ncbi:rRNA-processing protein EFG1 [Tanacetum coccineum]
MVLKDGSYKKRCILLYNNWQDRLLKDTRAEVKEALTKKLEALKSQQQALDNLALERKIFLRDRKIKFFERRKVERQIRRLEKQQRASSGQAQETEIAEQLSKLKEDLEYIRFFPKTEKYVSLFKKGDTTETVDKRDSLRTQIKKNIAAAVASGKDLEADSCVIAAVLYSDVIMTLAALTWH